MTCVALALARGAAGVRELLEIGRSRELSFVCLIDEADADLLPVAEVLGDVLTVRGDDLAPVVRALSDRRVDAVATFSDRHLVTVADLGAALGLPALTPAAARRIRSKHAQRQRLNDAGVGRVATHLVRGRGSAAQVPTDMAFPIVLKPERSTGAAFTTRVDSAQELSRALAELPDTAMVAEALVPPARHPTADWLGDMVSVDSIVAGERISHVGVADRFMPVAPFREAGLIMPTLLPAEVERAVFDVTERAIRALEVNHAVVHTELRLTGAEPVIVEVNARLGGYVDLGWRRAGVPSPLAAAFDIALGQSPDPPRPADRHIGLRILHAPMEAQRLVVAPEVKDVLTLPGVWRVDRNRGPGDSLDWRDGAHGRILDVWYEADDAPTLERRDRAVMESLGSALVFETAAGLRAGTASPA